MKIKAQGLLNAAKYVEETYGQDALRDVIRACSKDVRDRYVSAIAIEWHPMEELVEFLTVGARVLGVVDVRLAEEVGAAGARSNLKGAMARTAFYVARPEFLLRRVASLWHQFNDEGAMTLVSLEPALVRLEVAGVTNPSYLFCCTLVGWSREIVTAFGGENPVARHPECRARGQQHCIWEVRWSEPKPGAPLRRG